MTARMQLLFTDDLDEAAGVLTDIGPDGQVVVLAIDGFVRELHLTSAHAEQLRAEMKPWISAGHEPGLAPEPPARVELGRRRMTGQGKRRELPGTREFLRHAREYCQDAGIDIPQAGRDDNKKNYVYTTDAKDAYLAHLMREANRAEDGGAAAAELAVAAQLGWRTPYPPPPAGT
jgi:hypothetical protein